MPRQLNDAEHVIALVHKETKKRGRAVTFGQVAAMSRRDREDLRKAADQLVADGVLILENSPEGARGRPTVYMYLANKWVEPPPSLTRPLGQLVPTQEPSEIASNPLGESDPEVLVELPENSDPFLLVGPQWIKLISESKNSMMSSDKTLDQVKYFMKKYELTGPESIRIWNRLARPAYDEFWTEFGIVSHVKTTTSGARDRRYGDGDGQMYVVRHHLPKDIDLKKERQEADQEEMVSSRLEGSDKTEEELREDLQFPEPSNDLPDMTEFKRRLQAIL